jgi:hypothetical protein
MEFTDLLIKMPGIPVRNASNRKDCNSLTGRNIIPCGFDHTTKNKTLNDEKKICCNILCHTVFDL